METRALQCNTLGVFMPVVVYGKFLLTIFLDADSLVKNCLIEKCDFK